MLEFEAMQFLFVPSVVRNTMAQTELHVTLEAFTLTRDAADDIAGFERVIAAGDVDAMERRQSRRERRRSSTLGAVAVAKSESESVESPKKDEQQSVKTETADNSIDGDVASDDDCNNDENDDENDQVRAEETMEAVIAAEESGASSSLRDTHVPQLAEPPCLVLTYVHREASEVRKRATSSDPFHRKVHVQTRNWTVVYDHRFWARVYQFIFGSEFGRQFEHYVEDNITGALGVVVSERVDVRVVALDNVLVLPPYAGYGGPAPLAGFVLRLATERASFGSADAEMDWRAASGVPDDLRHGLFVEDTHRFPHCSTDYSGASDFMKAHGHADESQHGAVGLPARSQRFAMRLPNMR